MMGILKGKAGGDSALASGGRPKPTGKPTCLKRPLAWTYELEPGASINDYLPAPKKHDGPAHMPTAARASTSLRMACNRAKRLLAQRVKGERLAGGDPARLCTP